MFLYVRQFSSNETNLALRQVFEMRESYKSIPLQTNAMLVTVHCDLRRRMVQFSKTKLMPHICHSLQHGRTRVVPACQNLVCRNKGPIGTAERRLQSLHTKSIYCKCAAICCPRLLIFCGSEYTLSSKRLGPSEGTNSRIAAPCEVLLPFLANRNSFALVLTIFLANSARV